MVKTEDKDAQETLSKTFADVFFSLHIIENKGPYKSFWAFFAIT